MKPIPILGLGINSGFPAVTGQERINCYLEPQKDAEKTRIVAYGTAGKTTFLDLGDTPIRGGYSFGDYLYLAWEDGFYQMNNAGVATLIGTLNTSQGYVSMACNGFQIVIADGVALSKIYTIASGAFAASNSPALTTVCFMDGFFVGNQPSTGKFYSSDLYDGLVWSALQFQSAESNPDNLVAMFADHGGVIAFGDFTTEIFGLSSGGELLWSRVGYPIEWGLIAKASVAKLGDAVAFLARNRMGEAQVVLMNGYNPQRISTHDLERIINNSASLESATAFSYMQNGHQFYQLNCAGKSWLYDIASGAWSQLISNGILRDKGNYGFNLLNQVLVADYDVGKLYRMSDDVYSDDGDPLIMTITGKHVFGQGEPFDIGELFVDMETGVGATSGQGENPQIMLKTSRDDRTYHAERWASFGKIGEYTRRAVWSRLGTAYSFTFSLTISDPVKRCIIGAWVE